MTEARRKKAITWNGSRYDVESSLRAQESHDGRDSDGITNPVDRVIRSNSMINRAANV